MTPTNAAPTATTPTTTQVLIYTPVNRGGALQPGLTVTGTYKATCQGSDALVRSDSLRCFLASSASLPDGSNLLDPCFSATSGSAYCSDSPDSKTVVRVDETAPVVGPDKDPSSPTAGYPWAIELADGDVCTDLTGATDVLDGQREDYGCATGSLYGVPDRSSALWRIFYAANGSTTQTQVVISKVWF